MKGHKKLEKEFSDHRARVLSFARAFRRKWQSSFPTKSNKLMIGENEALSCTVLFRVEVDLGQGLLGFHSKARIRFASLVERPFV